MGVVFVYIPAWKRHQCIKAAQNVGPEHADTSHSFFVWAVYGITSEMEYTEFSVTAFVTALVTGSGLGWALARAGEPVRLEAASGRIHRPGSPVTLILVLIGFSSKFALQTMLGHQPALAADPNFNILYGAIAGAVDGVFWGRTLLQLRQAFLNKAPSSHSTG